MKILDFSGLFPAVLFDYESAWAGWVRRASEYFIHDMAFSHLDLPSIVGSYQIHLIFSPLLLLSRSGGWQGRSGPTGTPTFSCTAPQCTLHCTALQYTALHCTALHYPPLYSALHCTALPPTVLCTTLHCTTLHCSLLYYVLNWLALHSTLLY